MTKEEAIEYIFTYWSQLTVLIAITTGGIGFIIKLFLNWNIKKKEITYNKIRETKLKELKQFYSSYFNLIVSLKDLQFFTAQNRIEHESRIREQLPNLWKQFYTDLTFLRLFLKGKEIGAFEELKQEIENIQLKLNYYQLDRELEDFDKELIKELRDIRDNVFPKRIPQLLLQIETNLKTDFRIN